MATNPSALWLLVLLVPIGAALLARYRSGREDLTRLVGRWREAPMHNTHLVKWFFEALALVLFVAFCALAAAEISWGRYAVSTSYTGTDVALLVDISGSMLTQDVYPSRIKRVSGVIQDIVDANPGTRFSLVIFKGRGVVAVPPTDDPEPLLSVAKILSPAMFSSVGTNIEQGIRAAMTAFPPDDGAKRIILLFSDGGALAGNAVRAAQAAAAAKIGVAVVAVGTTAGGPIPLGNGKFIESSNGHRVISTLDVSALDQIAKAGSGGLYFITNPLITQQLNALVAGHPAASAGGGYHFQSKDQYRVFVVAALVCLMILVFARVIRWRNLV